MSRRSSCVPALWVNAVQLVGNQSAAHRQQHAEMRDRIRRHGGVEVTGQLGGPDEFGDPLRAVAQVRVHQRGQLRIAPGRDQRLHDQVTAGVPATGQTAPDQQQHVADGPGRIGPQDIGQQPRTVRPHGLHQQLGLGAEVSVERRVAHPGGAWRYRRRACRRNRAGRRHPRPRAADAHEPRRPSRPRSGPWTRI